ncbi:DUF1622 domain-containing protein [Patescibacteria group bacterium]|nr:DUF1622 domain-containing protein [Patescibacteria group bacterium]
MNALSLAQTIGTLLDLVGVFVIVMGAVASFLTAFKEFLDQKSGDAMYRSFRKNLGKGILLGLEFLVAGDIIRSIIGTPDFTTVGVLVVIVLVRSFLSVTFEMEVDGRWPWQRGRS